MTIGTCIVVWREERGFSQAELARRARVSRAFLNALEANRRDVTLGTLRRIAEALGVTAGTLADGILPGNSRPLSRSEMEEIAKSVASEGTVRQFPAITTLLRAATRSRRSAAGASTASGPRTGRIARTVTMALKEAVGKPQLESLLSRVDEHVRRHEAG